MQDRKKIKRTPLRVEIVADKPEQRGEMRAALGTISDPPLEVVEIEPSEGDGRPNGKEPQPADVSMVMFNGNESTSMDYLQRKATLAPRPVLFALLAERSPGLMKRVIRAGADELIFMPLEGGDLTRALLKISESRLRADRREGGTVVSVTSVVGGVGVTTIAANLALALRQQSSKRVALMDLDLQSGALGVTLNLEPEVTILPLIRLDRRLDSIQLESALTRHSSGVYLLAAPKKIEEGEIVTDVAIGAILDQMREMFDYVVVDCGARIDENAVAAWERSHHLLYVLNQSVVSVRCAWRFIDLFERLGIHGLEAHYIVNRFSPSSAIGDRQVESTLGREIWARIPRDDRALERAELTGETLWKAAPGAGVTRALEQLAVRFDSHRQETEAHDGIVSRLFSAFSRQAN